MIYYPVPMPPPARLRRRRLPVVPGRERLAAEVLSLPIGPHLAPETIDQVAAATRRALA